MKRRAVSLRKLSLLSIQEDPYVMLDSSDSILQGNARFEGFCIDLLEEIAKLLNIDYTIKLVDDGKYGAPVGPNGEWNGMVRELIDQVLVMFGTIVCGFLFHGRTRTAYLYRCVWNGITGR